MKKNLLFLFLFVSLITNAQERLLSGKVVNQNNEPLGGASVIVKGLNKGVATDEEGNFKLRLAEGGYILQISYIGYQSQEQEINLVGDNSMLITLSSNEFILDEVLVSAVRANSNTPVTFTNFDKKEIAKRNLGQDIPILLNYLPSVISSSDAGAGIGYTYLNVRGSNSERINVTINGIPYNDAESHGTFWVNLGDFASSTENLQLQRGVGTSTNGSGAFGASLNILTDAMADEAGVKARILSGHSTPVNTPLSLLREDSTTTLNYQVDFQIFHLMVMSTEHSPISNHIFYKLLIATRIA